MRMSTLAEIEAAVVTLGPRELDQLEKLLLELRAQHQRESSLQDLYRVTGFDPLPKRSEKVITIEMVRQLCEEEGI
jgi:hypothetical protein